MSEEEANLATYTLQLQQVEAALTNDPSNPELNKLKSDLEEIINLTRELIDTTKAAHSSNNDSAPSDASGSKRSSHGDNESSGSKKRKANEENQKCQDRKSRAAFLDLSKWPRNRLKKCAC